MSRTKILSTVITIITGFIVFSETLLEESIIPYIKNNTIVIVTEIKIPLIIFINLFKFALSVFSIKKSSLIIYIKEDTFYSLFFIDLEKWFK